MKTNNKVPPQNNDMEMFVLCCCMLEDTWRENDSYERACGRISIDDFYDPRHKLIWTAIGQVIDSGLPSNRMTLIDRLMANGTFDDAGGYEHLSEITYYISTNAHLDSYVVRLKEMSVRRRAGSLFYEATNCLAGQLESNPTGEQLQGIITKIVSLYNELQVEKVVTPAEAIDATLALAYDRHDNPHKLLKTGIKELDEQITGLFPPDLIVIAGRPSMGKTDLALNILFNIANTGVPVAFASIEMGMNDVYARLMSLHTGIWRSKFRNGNFDSTDKTALERVEQLKLFPLFVKSGRFDLFKLRDWANERKQRDKVKVLAIDYLQIVTPQSARASREQQVSAISAGLKSLAVELNIPVIAVSQMSRAAENREDQRPQMSDLRDSGAIEQDADIIGMINRASYRVKAGEEKPLATEDHMDIHIVKNRQGSVGDVTGITYDRATGHIGKGNRIVREEQVEQPKGWEDDQINIG